MYSVDPYTFTGIQGIFKLSDRWSMMTAIQAGNDMAPWTTSSQPNVEFLLKWVSPNNKDMLFGGVDSVGKGYYKNGHDDLQVSSLLWEHKFTDKLHTITEMYYIWQRNALTGGSVINGPPHSFFPGVGPGALIHGLSDSLGVVNYTSYKLSDKDRLTMRFDVLDDFQGQRLGFKTTYVRTHPGLGPLFLRLAGAPSRNPVRLHERRQGHRKWYEARDVHILDGPDHSILMSPAADFSVPE
jgi:Putative beta-barrel porin-2, OmpL-like. bbp2